MSCGLPDPPALKIPIPKPQIPKMPAVPPIPDYSWAADLGISIDVPTPKPPIPKPQLPKMPTLPDVPALPCPFDEDPG
jgi:hypothetical protein